MIGISRFKNNFSSNLDKIGSNDIGLNEETIEGGLPGLVIIITSTTFHKKGKIFPVNTGIT